MADVDFDLRGIPELIQTLSKVNNRANAELGRALKAGAKVILDDAKSRIHDRSGDLAASIDFQLKKKTATSASGLIGTAKGKDGGWYAMMVEYGHKVVARKPKATRTGRVMRLHVRGGGKGRVIGQAAPHPFFRPALIEKSTEAQMKIASELRKAIEGAAR